MTAVKEFIEAMNSTPTLWRPLVASGVAKTKADGTSIVYSVNYRKVDELLSAFFIEHTVESLTEMVELGMTATKAGHDLLGLPKTDQTLAIPAGSKVSIADLFGMVIRTRLATGVDGNVQGLLNSDHGLWLVTVKHDGQSLYAATKDAHLVNTAFSTPRMMRQVGMKVKEAVTAMTLAYRIPETAAQTLAALDVQSEALALARSRGYDQITEGMSAAEINELDANVGTHAGAYRTVAQEKLQAISKSEPKVPKSDSDDETSAA